MKKRILGLEDLLEVDKYHEIEQQAKQSSEASIIKSDIKADIKADEISKEKTDEADSTSIDDASLTEDTSATDENASGEDTSSEDDKTNDTTNKDAEPKEGSDSNSDIDSVEKDNANDSKDAMESFRHIKYQSLSTEDLSYVANKVVSGFSEGLSFLKYLGINYGPIILSKAYKGVVYAMGKLIKYLFISINKTYTYLERRVNSFENLKSNLADAKEALDELRKKESLEDLSDIKYDKQNIINALKIGNNIDLTNNIMVLNGFIESTIKELGSEISKDISKIRYIIASTLTNNIKEPAELMKIEPHFSNFTKVSYDDVLLNKYIYSNDLPGDINFISILPSDSMSTKEDVINGYNKAEMFLTIKADNFQEVKYIDYMDIDQLDAFINKLDLLCDTCIKHKAMYENVVHNKKNLRFDFKRYFLNIINSDSKVSFKDSLLELVYLKSIFIDKVYLTASMDIHDYAARTIVKSLSYINDNMKRL